MSEQITCSKEAMEAILDERDRLREENRRLNEALDGLEVKWGTGGPKPDCTCPADTHFHRGNCPAYLWRLATQGNSAIMRKICADELRSARAAIQGGTRQ